MKPTPPSSKAASAVKRRTHQTQSTTKGSSSNGSNSVKSWSYTPYGAKLTVVAGMVLAGLCYLYLNGQRQITVFVSSTDHVDRAVHNLPCSSDYDQELFHECKPRRCARVVMDNLVSAEDAKYLLSVAQKGLALGGSSGGASILDLHTGALSKGNAFIDIYRLIKSENIQLLTEEDFIVYRKVKNQIRDAIAQEFEIPPNKLYLTQPTFFSRMNMTSPKTVHDEYWHPHIDKVTYGSFHYTSLLYLATYRQDFRGGRFIFVDEGVNRTVEPKLGRVSFFTSGSENLHYVERLSDGVRFAITVSFTCDPDKAIDDPVSR